METNLRDEGPPSLARSGTGDLLMAWSQEVDPGVAGQDGSVIRVASYNPGTSSWTPPLEIPASLGYNTSVTPVFHGPAPMVIWSRTDTTGLTSATTPAQLDAALASAEIVYSVRSGGVWSAPVVLAAGGRQTAVTAAPAADGRVIAAWFSRATETSPRQLRAAFWDGGSWTAVEMLAEGAFSGAPAIGVDGADTLLVWASGVDAQATSLLTRTHRSGSWLAEAVFDPGLQAALIPVGARASAADYRIAFVPPPPDIANCCPPPPKKPKKPDLPEDDDDDDDDGGKPNYNPAVVFPKDPNDILGPEGYGPERWVRGDQSMLYTIRFENDPDWATAPAQEVTITQQLDPDLDPRTFRVGAFGWGPLRFTPTDSRAFYSERLDLRAEYGYFVDVSAFVDVTTGIARWQITTIDPATGQKPADALVGFLLPNDDDGIGEGFVTYTVTPKRTLATGAVVDAEASIVFDTESAIDTPAIFNTVDNAAPTSAMTPLPARTTDADFVVKWSGADDAAGSGLAGFTVYVSVDGGGFTEWLRNTPLTEAPFSGALGSSYAFYVIATDHAGMTEQKAPVAETSTIAGTEYFTLAYTAGTGGSILGEASQTVEINHNGAPVQAVADSGWVFRAWSDGLTESTRMEVDVVAPLALTAYFDPAQTAGGVDTAWYASFGLGPAADESWTQAQWDALDDEDPDFDGQENWKEARTGMSPVDAREFFHVRQMAKPAADRVRLKWPSAAGRTYRIEASGTLLEDSWSPVVTGIPASPPENEQDVPVPMPAAPTRLFYRVVIEAGP